MRWSSQNTWQRRCLELKRSLHLVSAHSLFNSTVAAFVIPSSEIYFCCSSLGLLQLALATKSRDVKLPWTVHGCGKKSGAGEILGTNELEEAELLLPLSSKMFFYVNSTGTTAGEVSWWQSPTHTGTIWPQEG